MILTKEHIGKKVTNGYGETGTVLGVLEEAVWFLREGHSTPSTYIEHDWQLFEPKKKPSEWIAEISKIYGSDPAANWAIVKYLDKQAEDECR